MKYEQPKIEIILCGSFDVITTSTADFVGNGFEDGEDLDLLALGFD